jgi:hypothetical protein
VTQCTKQLVFPFFQKAKLTATFDGGSIVTDGGLLLVRQFDEKVRFTEALSRAVYDPRDPRLVLHSQAELLRQRVYQIIAGYEDANDATLLRHDPLFKAVVGRCPEDQALGSQPTLSRLENRVSLEAQMEIVETLVRLFIATRPEPLSEITLDVDPSEAQTYGQQEFTAFNAHYESHMYFPQFVCDAKTRFLLAAVLRPGHLSAPDGAIRLLSRIVQLLRAAWPGIKVSVRAHSHFAEPALLNWLEEEEIRYAVGMQQNKVLDRLSAPFVKSVEERFRVTGRPQRSFTTFAYKTLKTWARPRRVVAKVEVTPAGTNVRYVIAGRAGRSSEIYDWYVGRGGTIEDAIEQLKNAFEGDRMSCRKFQANAFRLLLHTAAYDLMVLSREGIAVPELADANIQTVRTKLIKVGARVRRTVRRLWVELSSTWPFAKLFARGHAALVPEPGG